MIVFDTPDFKDKKSASVETTPNAWKSKLFFIRASF